MKNTAQSNYSATITVREMGDNEYRAPVTRKRMRGSLTDCLNYAADYAVNAAFQVVEVSIGRIVAEG
jgi:hypothetical protein